MLDAMKTSSAASVSAPSGADQVDDYAPDGTVTTQLDAALAWARTIDFLHRHLN